MMTPEERNAAIVKRWEDASEAGTVYLVDQYRVKHIGDEEEVAVTKANDPLPYVKADGDLFLIAKKDANLSKAIMDLILAGHQICQLVETETGKSLGFVIRLQHFSKSMQFLTTWSHPDYEIKGAK